jgi:hypothetical protein
VGGNLGTQVWLLPSSGEATGDGTRAGLGSAQLVGGELYRFDPNPTGDRIVIAPYTGPVARLLPVGKNARGDDLPVAELALMGEGGRYPLVEGGVEQRVPEGAYHSVATVRQPDGEEEWQFQFRSQAPAALTASSESQRLTFGGPLRAAIAPEAKQLAAQRGQRFQLKVRFVAESGHELFGLERPGPGSAAAQVVVRSSSGVVVARGASGFG